MNNEHIQESKEMINKHIQESKEMNNEHMQESKEIKMSIYSKVLRVHKEFFKIRWLACLQPTNAGQFTKNKLGAVAV
jgi:hypothetical protein